MTEKRRETLPRKSAWISKRTLRTVCFVSVIVVCTAWFLSSKTGYFSRNATPDASSKTSTNRPIETVLGGSDTEEKKGGTYQETGKKSDLETPPAGAQESKQTDEESDVVGPPGVIQPPPVDSQARREPVVGEAKDELQWWQKAIFYHIYPRSFKDSSDDGIGDLKGLMSKLEYLKDLGIGAIMLSPVYTSPMKDFGYDVTNFIDVDPMFGTLADFDALIKGIHKLGMKLIMDYIPNHTSDKHLWFNESLKGEDNNKFTNFYIWKDGKTSNRVPPNNWECKIGGSAWTWSDARKKYYYHEYMPEQPDLDWRNPDVRHEMENVLKFWLEKGVDGFRLDAISKLFEDEGLADEPFNPDGKSLNKIYTKNQPQIYEELKKWRKFFDDFEKAKTRDHIYVIAEVYDKSMVHAVKYYDCGTDGPFNFNLTYVTNKTQADGIFDIVNSWLSRMPKGKWATWVTGNHDRSRIVDRKGPAYINAFNALVMLLPGTPYTYQGEELGMRDIHPSFEESQDPRGKSRGKDLFLKFTRDFSRGPMQWSSEEYAGFSKTKPWLPVNGDYKTNNAEVQKSNETSPLQVYKSLAKLRRETSFQKGSMTYCINNEIIFSFVRRFQEEPAYLVAINFGKETSTDDYWIDVGAIFGSLPTAGKVSFSTRKGDNLKVEEAADKESLSSVTLNPGEVLVVQFSLPKV